MNNCISSLRWIIILLLCHVCAFSALAQTPADKFVVQVGENIQVSREMPNSALVEQQIAAHPKNPNHLLGAAIVASTPAPWAATQDCAAFVSFDGGKTWSNHQFGIHGCGDPWVTIGTDDTAYFIALGANGLVAFRSTDGGNKWSDPPVSLGNGHDHPAVVAVWRFRYSTPSLRLSKRHYSIQALSRIT